MIASLALLAAAGAAAQVAQPYRYVPIPPVTEGSVVYAYRDSGNVPVALDLLAFWDLQKSILATDQKGIDELQAAGRLVAVPVGTALRVLQSDDGTAAKVPAYEVRILEGKRKESKGWVVMSWVRGRVKAPAKSRRRP